MAHPPAPLLRLTLGCLAVLLCLPTVLPTDLPTSHHLHEVAPSRLQHRRLLEMDEPCRFARAGAQHSSMPLQRVLMDTLNASRAHPFATGLAGLFLQVNATAAPPITLTPLRRASWVIRAVEG
jgi:hypothetical protein